MDASKTIYTDNNFMTVCVNGLHDACVQVMLMLARLYTDNSFVTVCVNGLLDACVQVMWMPVRLYIH